MSDTYLNSLLGQDEKIEFVTRHHWTLLAAEILSESVLTIAVIVLVTLLVFVLVNPLWAAGYLLLVLPLVSLTRDLIRWANRKFIVTNRRVIHIEGVLSKDVTDSSLEKVNDVKLEQSFAGRLLNYGDVEILTASELGVNKFTRIAAPIQFKTAMLNAKHRLDERMQSPVASAPSAKAAAASGTAAPDLASLLLQLDQLRQNGVLTEAEFQSKKAQLLARM